MDRIEFMSLFKKKIEREIYDLRLIYNFYKENGSNEEEIPEETGVLLEIIQEDLLSNYFYDNSFMISPEDREKKYEDLNDFYMICQEETIIFKRIANYHDYNCPEEIYHYDIDMDDIDINSISSVKELRKTYKKELMLSDYEIDLINKDSFYNFAYKDDDPYDAYYHYGVIVDLNKAYDIYMSLESKRLMKLS